ncbi:MAG TPA: SpoIIE family protein phosphatase, partial [Acidimicrobiia bacterium]
LEPYQTGVQQAAAAETTLRILPLDRGEAVQVGTATHAYEQWQLSDEQFISDMRDGRVSAARTAERDQQAKVLFDRFRNDQAMLATVVDAKVATTRNSLRHTVLATITSSILLGIVGLALTTLLWTRVRRWSRRDRDLERRRAELYDAEHRLAVTIQEAMLGHTETQSDRIRAGARYRPSDDSMLVGGDWFDVVPIPDGRTGLIVGDVVGHGVESIAAMSQLRSAATAFTYTTSGPDDVVQLLDEYARASTPDSFATCLVMMIDDRGEISWSSAGHLPALMVNPDGETSFLEGALGPPLGATRITSARHRGHALLGAESAIVLYTDGLIERRGEPLDRGFARLASAAGAHARASVDELCDGLLADLLEGRAQDDVVVMAARLQA